MDLILRSSANHFAMVIRMIPIAGSGKVCLRKTAGDIKLPPPLTDSRVHIAAR